MPIYNVVKPIRGADGKKVAAGGTIELTERQAKYLLLSGKITAGKAKAAAPAKSGEKKKEN